MAALTVEQIVKNAIETTMNTFVVNGKTLTEWYAVIAKGECAPVVRCVNCIHHYVGGNNVKYSLCDLGYNACQSDDWFCADGEAKGDE